MLSLQTPFCMQGQMAAVTSMHVLVKTKKKLHLGELRSTGVGCAERAMLEAQPELAQLEWCLRIMLADYPCHPAEAVSGVMKGLPNVHREMVRSSTTPFAADFSFASVQMTAARLKCTAACYYTVNDRIV